MIITNEEIVCPAGKPGKSPILIPLKAILTAEQRQDEVATVNKVKAPELLAAFNRSWREIHEHITKLTAEKNAADKEIKRRRAFLLLEVVDKKLKDAGLFNNDDHRQAVVENDQEYCNYCDTVDEIKAVIEYLKGKLKSFDNAFTSVKRLVAEDAFNHAGGGKNPNLSGNTDVPAEPAPTGKKQWGKAKY